MAWQRRAAYGFAAAGLLLVAGTAADWASAHGERTPPQFWLVVIPVALLPHATVAVAVGTARGGFWGRYLVGVAGVAVVGLGALMFRDADSQPPAGWGFGPSRPSLFWASATVTFWLTAQGVAALVAAVASGLTWVRRPRYGLWVLFTVVLCAFALVADFTERLERSIAFDWLPLVRAVTNGRPDWYRWISYQEVVGLAQAVLPAACLGWLAQCAAPRRRRRVPDQVADYGEQRLPPTGG